MFFGHQFGVVLEWVLEGFWEVKIVDFHVFPQLGSPTGPKGVLSKLDGRLLFLAPAGSPEPAAGSPAIVEFPKKVEK